MTLTGFEAGIWPPMLKFRCPRCDGGFVQARMDEDRHEWSGVCPACRHRCDVNAADVRGYYHAEAEDMPAAVPETPALDDRGDGHFYVPYEIADQVKASVALGIEQARRNEGTVAWDCAASGHVQSAVIDENGRRTCLHCGEDL